MARLKNGSLPMVGMDTALCRSVGPGDCATDLETGLGPMPDQTCLANATRLPHFVMLGQSLEATLFSLDGARHEPHLRPLTYSPSPMAPDQEPLTYGP